MSEQARTETSAPKGWLRALPNDSPVKSIVVTLLVCIVASVLVTSTAVLLRPKQIANKQSEQTQRIAEILQGTRDVGDVDIAGLTARVVDLATGNYIDGMDPASFDPRQIAREPEDSVSIPPELDVAQIKRRAKYAVVHLLLQNDKPEIIVLPVHGRGFASTLYGYIGLSGDTKTVTGLAFYEHGETPGLGALVDDPGWRRMWVGKKVWDAAGEVGLGVARGPVVAGTPEAESQVDGLTGATWTGQGVTSLLRYWLGDHGFGPYLKNVKRTGR